MTTLTDERRIVVPEADILDAIEELRYVVAYPAHRRHTPCPGGIDFCHHDICRIISAVTNGLERYVHDRSQLDEVVPDPAKQPSARRARKTRATRKETR